MTALHDNPMTRHDIRSPVVAVCSQHHRARRDCSGDDSQSFGRLRRVLAQPEARF
jgi:hypothetical protein